MRCKTGFLIVTALAVSLTLAAPTRAEGYITADHLDQAQSDIADLASKLGSSVEATQQALEAVRDMDNESEREKLITDRFNAIEHEVRGVLQKVSLNSPLMDALDDARAKTLVLQRWWERQPATYPKRDESIARLDAALQQYEDQASSINQRQQDAARALADLGKARHFIIMQVKIDKIEASVASLNELVGSLDALVSNLTAIASAQLPDSDSVAAIDQN